MGKVTLLKTNNVQIRLLKSKITEVFVYLLFINYIYITKANTMVQVIVIYIYNLDLLCLPRVITAIKANIKLIGNPAIHPIQ